MTSKPRPHANPYRVLGLEAPATLSKVRAEFERLIVDTESQEERHRLLLARHQLASQASNDRWSTAWQDSKRRMRSSSQNGDLRAVARHLLIHTTNYDLHREVNIQSRNNTTLGVDALRDSLGNPGHWLHSLVSPAATPVAKLLIAKAAYAETAALGVEVGKTTFPEVDAHIGTLADVSLEQMELLSPGQLDSSTRTASGMQHSVVRSVRATAAQLLCDPMAEQAVIAWLRDAQGAEFDDPFVPSGAFAPGKADEEHFAPSDDERDIRALLDTAATAEAACQLVERGRIHAYEVNSPDLAHALHHRTVGLALHIKPVLPGNVNEIPLPGALADDALGAVAERLGANDLMATITQAPGLTLT